MIKINLNSTEIKESLNIVKGGVESNSNHAILSYVLLQIKNQQLTLTTTNSEIEIKTIKPIKLEVETEFTVCLIDLFNIIEKLDKDENVEFLIDEQQLTIIASKNKFRLNTIKVKEFHSLIENSEIIEKFKINKKSLYELITKTKFSIANESPQQYLNGLFLSITKEKILTASSDGHRLALAKNKQINDVLEDKNAIIPKKTVNEIIKILNETTDEFIKIGVNQNYIVVDNNKTTITSKLIEGNYPDYKQVIPTVFDSDIIINKKEFEKSLKQVEIFTKESKIIKLSFSNNELFITAESEKGRAEAVIKTKNFNNKLTINFNASYLIQTLENISSEEILFNINSEELKIVVITGTNNKDYKYAIMSIKI